MSTTDKSVKPLVSGSKLKAWRLSQKLTLEELGELLGPPGDAVSGPTVGRWEGGQAIPGPAQLLLAWLIWGRVPFKEVSNKSSDLLKSSAWKLEMSLAAFQKLQALALAEGFEDLTDYLGVLAVREMNKPASEK